MTNGELYGPTFVLMKYGRRGDGYTKDGQRVAKQLMTFLGVCFSSPPSLRPYLFIFVINASTYQRECPFQFGAFSLYVMIRRRKKSLAFNETNKFKH